MVVPAWAAAAWTSLTTALILPGIPGAAAENKQAICLARHWSEVEAEFIQWPVCVESRWERTGPRTTQDTTGSPDQTVSVTISEGAPSKTAIPAPEGQPDNELDTESPLDNSNFLSFEDWKKQNLAKVGQSAENVRGNRHTGGKEDRRRPTGINNALDSLGEDAEIELDFGGFGADASDAAKPTPWGSSIPTAGMPGAGAGDVEAAVPADLRKAASRGKDAGTTCKERFNYASFDCAATVLKTNPECKGSSSVLVENKDSYMLNECRAKNKFIILELCDDILVDTVVLANYEFFSSIFHTFRVSVADRYPAKTDQWRELGVYEARNTREIQAFAVENPLIWARYVKVEFLTHYGNEFYCPLSLVRIHGTTMLEEYKHDGETNRGDEEAAAEALEPSPLPLQLDVKDVVQQPATTVAVLDESTNQPTVIVETQGSCSHQGMEVVRLLQQGVSPPADTCDIRAAPTGAGNAAVNQSTEIHPKANEEATPSAEASAPASRVDHSDKGSVGGQKVTGPTGASPDSASSTILGTETVRHDAAHESEIKSVSSPKEESSIPSESVRPSGTQPPSSNPTTQESFFKSVNKRLQMLESNSTLSLLYIEEQSRILRDAFSKVEKRQLAKTSTFLENLNVTVLNELRQFREQYDQVWKSVALEFEHQRIQYHQEIHSISAQLGILADELVFQKRVSVIQSIMILFCFALVLFPRVPVGTYIDIPRVQNMMNRSYSLRSSSPIFFGSPSASPSSTRPTSSYRATGRHRRNLSEDSQEEPLSPTIAYSPPTPTSDPSDPDEADKRPAPSLDTVNMSDLAPPHFRSHSSPPVLNPADEESQSDDSPISYESRGSSDYDSPGSPESSEPILANNGSMRQEG
ncbi:UNC-like C-terminal-domain-containing protein [Aspergillus pseudocaelatus]|uniref:UNC-like C-terminal-domain-containing protein n=1 Tax=Aspergillus pseudocaelatus TaxID=1825620 RepID=A0ABQ6WQX6_9EURO|nr:UNC-like C-terminal-domain-containing protein [Aspergillus pseudocaelatus]